MSDGSGQVFLWVFFSLLLVLLLVRLSRRPPRYSLRARDVLKGHSWCSTHSSTKVNAALCFCFSFLYLNFFEWRNLCDFLWYFNFLYSGTMLIVLVHYIYWKYYWLNQDFAISTILLFSKFSYLFIYFHTFLWLWLLFGYHQHLPQPSFCSICETLINASDGSFCNSCGVSADSPQCITASDISLPCKVITTRSTKHKHHWIRGSMSFHLFIHSKFVSLV